MVSKGDVLNLMSVLGDRPIAYHPLLAHALGCGAASALYLSQLLYWSDKGWDVDNWIHKTEAEFAEETGLTRREQSTARSALVKCGVLEVKREGLPARLFFRLLPEALAEIISNHLATSCAKRTHQLCKTHTPVVQNEQLYTESTTESTTSISITKRARAKENPAERLMAVFEDEAFMQALTVKFPGADVMWERQKMERYVEDRPPKGNYKNFVANWIERVAKQEGANGRTQAVGVAIGRSAEERKWERWEAYARGDDMR